MDDVDVGSLVLSIAGRDKGELFAVLRREGEFLYLANGRGRKVDKPKKKKIKHAKPINLGHEGLKKKLMSGEMPTNAELRKSLRDFSAEFKGKGGFDHGKG
jgi:large subunit ribosomal protein L14e